VVASGPAGPRRRLGAELRRLRSGAGLHLDQVAVQLQCSTSKISRLETGKGIPKAADVRALIRIYGVASDTERGMLLRLVRESRTEGWWESYTDGLAPERFVLDVQQRYTALEAEAKVIRSYDPAILHGLLQVPAYTQAVMELLLPNHSPHEIEQLVELRARRREALTVRNPPLKLVLVLDEAVLRRPVGGPEVMVDQLSALVNLSELPSVSLRLLPFAAGLHRVQIGRFDILEFADEAVADVVYVEGHAGETYLESPSDVDLYKDVLNDAVDHALPPEASRALIADYLDEYATPEGLPVDRVHDQ
jgi:transcriptional regulator with XRE-family HTH domain